VVPSLRTAPILLGQERCSGGLVLGARWERQRPSFVTALAVPVGTAPICPSPAGATGERRRVGRRGIDSGARSLEGRPDAVLKYENGEHHPSEASARIKAYSARPWPHSSMNRLACVGSLPLQHIVGWAVHKTGRGGLENSSSYEVVRGAARAARSGRENLAPGMALVSRTNLPWECCGWATVRRNGPPAARALDAIRMAQSGPREDIDDEGFGSNHAAQ
jgi:hypothetical protein